jgi:exodeoxyribonuclease VII small subunit
VRRNPVGNEPGELRFREGIERLEAIVSGLEGDALELEEALERYEEGLALYRELCAVLARAEERIEALGGERGGALVWKKFTGAVTGGEGEPHDKPAAGE